MIAADPFMLVFRSLHIVAGVLWVGSAFLVVGFVGRPRRRSDRPRDRCSPPPPKRKVTKVITSRGAVNVIAGTWSA
jgi:hypothetical protein